VKQMRHDLDANRMPAATLALQGFQAVAWPRIEIAEVTGVMKQCPACAWPVFQCR